MQILIKSYGLCIPTKIKKFKNPKHVEKGEKSQNQFITKNSKNTCITINPTIYNLKCKIKEFSKE